MAQYFTSDFADFSACSGGACGDWTERYNTGGSWGVSSGNLDVSSGKLNDWQLLNWNDLDGDASRANAEVLILVTIPSSSNAQYPISVRAGGSDESTDQYLLYVLQSSNRLRISYTSGSDTPTEVATSTATTLTAGSDYWIRFRVNGSGPATVQARIWLDGSFEPGTWAINTTDSNGPTSAGWIGPAKFSTLSGTPTPIKQIGVGTNGDAAPASATSGISGALTATLGAATSSATGKIAISGTASQTLAAATLSSTGALAMSGVASPTLAAATLLAEGDLVISGALASTLGAATLVGTGELAMDTGTGTLAKTLDAATLAATGAVALAGTASPTLAAATLLGEGDLAISGALARTLAAATLAATGASLGPVSGSLSATLAAATLAAFGARAPFSASRALMVPAESRRLAVEPEDRALAIPHDNRTWSIEP